LKRINHLLDSSSFDVAPKRFNVLLPSAESGMCPIFIKTCAVCNASVHARDCVRRFYSSFSQLSLSLHLALPPPFELLKAHHRSRWPEESVEIIVDAPKFEMKWGSS
jgi:hypothetical protein